MTDDKLLAQRKEWLDKAVEYHGHVCMGQVIGVLLAEKGLDLIGTADSKNMIVISENDRCIGDALQILTGTRLGRRSFKLRDYGKMAATFINQKDGIAYRVWIGGNLPGTKDYHSLQRDEKNKVLMQVLEMDIDEILSFKKVKVEFLDNELPGKPKRVVRCNVCNEKVMDGKDIETGDKSLCRPCHGKAYYEPVE